jgi:hypothetical protein
MNKKILLAVMISVYIVVMSQSVSAVEYRVLDDHYTTRKLSKIEKIGTTLERCTSFFKNTKKDMKWFTSTQDGKILANKIIDLKTTLVNIPSRPTSIQLIFQFIIALIVSVIPIVFIIGTTLSGVFSSILTLFIMTLISLAIILINH